MRGALFCMLWRIPAPGAPATGLTGTKPAINCVLQRDGFVVHCPHTSEVET